MLSNIKLITNIKINPETSIIVKIVFVHADSLIPTKFTIEIIASKPIAEIIIEVLCLVS